MTTTHVTAADLYKRAHDLHYKENNLDEAEKLYLEVRGRFPDSPEAGYAATQLENIELVRNPPKSPEPERRTLEEEIAHHFFCLRCREREPKISRAPLGAGSGVYRDELATVYFVVTCVACGHTELLDAEIVSDRFVTR